MIISPNTINFNYKKFEQIPPGVLLNFSLWGTDLYFEEPNLKNVDGSVAEKQYDWLTVYDITQSSVKVKLNSDVNNLTAGEHSKTIDLLSWEEDINQSVVVGSFTVNLVLEDTILLSVSPENLSFSFEVGGITPVNKIVHINSENSWTITKNAAWLSLSKTSGSNNDTFEVGVVVAGLAPGVYNDTLTVNDGATPQTVSVQLTVSNENTSTDFLFVNPQLVKFGYSSGAGIPPQKTVVINASDNWTVTADQSWISLPIASGIAGAHVVAIALQNVNGLAVGDHFANVTFAVGNIRKTVVIQLSVFAFVTELLEEDALYFTDDANVIKVSSSRLDTFLKFDYNTVYKSVSYLFNARVPYFNGKAEKRIGMRPRKVIGKPVFSMYNTAELFQPYPVLNLNLTISEMVYFTELTAQTQTINNLKFLKGSKPVGLKLCNLPSKVYLTKNATLWLTALTNNLETDRVVVTGDHSKTFMFTPITAEFLTAVIPLSEIGTLAVGDSFTITLQSTSIEVVIKPEGTDYTTLWYANEWGVWECLECTGTVEVFDAFTRKFTTIRKNELETETKIIDVTKPMELRINSGNLYTDNEVERFKKMLQSEDVYIHIKNQYINQVMKVNPTLKKIPSYITDRNLRAFDLTFKNVIE